MLLITHRMDSTSAARVKACEFCGVCVREKSGEPPSDVQMV